jgi:hypothetical protein
VTICLKGDVRRDLPQIGGHRIKFFRLYRVFNQRIWCQRNAPIGNDELALAVAPRAPVNDIVSGGVDEAELIEGLLQSRFWPEPVVRFQEAIYGAYSISNADATKQRPCGRLADAGEFAERVTQLVFGFSEHSHELPES